MPFIDFLSKEINLDIELKFYENIPAFEKAFLEGASDLAFMNPYHAALAYKSQGYIPLVHDGSRNLYGIIVAAKNNPIQKIEELDQKQIVFPAPNAFGASRYLQSSLKKIKLISHQICQNTQ